MIFEPVGRLVGGRLLSKWSVVGRLLVGGSVVDGFNKTPYFRISYYSMKNQTITNQMPYSRNKTITNQRSKRKPLIDQET